MGISACKKEHPINIAALNYSIELTDSMNDSFSEAYNSTLEKIYKLSDDSLFADSISKLILLPDSFLFYPYLEYLFNNLKESYYIIQQEIFFAKDQLIGLKEDVKRKDISPVQYELQMEQQSKMLKLLHERIDSNILVFNKVILDLRLQTDSIF